MHLIWAVNVKVMVRTQAFRRDFLKYVSLNPICFSGGGGWEVGRWPYETLNQYNWFFFHGSAARSGPGPHRPGFTIILRHTTLGRTRPDEWSAWRRDLYVTAHKPQQTGIHALGRIRTHNPSKRVAADPRLRLRGHWDRQYNWWANINYLENVRMTYYGVFDLLQILATTLQSTNISYYCLLYHSCKGTREAQTMWSSKFPFLAQGI